MSATPKKIVDPAKIAQQTFSAEAKVQRNSEAGLSWTAVGALDAAKQVGTNVSVLVYNSDTAVHYVKFGASNVTAPTNATNGIPVPPGLTAVYSSGPNTHVISDSALVFGYKASSL